MTRFAVFGSVVILGAMSSLSGQQPKLKLQATDLLNNPVAGVRFSVANMDSSVSDVTNASGRTAVLLAANIKAGTAVELAVLSPDSAKYHLFSPWNHMVVVPPFDSAIEVRVSLHKIGTRIIIGELVITTIAERVTGSGFKDVNGAPRNDGKDSLAKVAREYQLSPEQVDAELRRFTSTDPYVRGVNALYKGLNREAVTLLSEAVKKPDLLLDRDLNAHLYLGHAQFRIGNYREAADAYGHAAAIASNDPEVLNNLAVALERISDLSGAETQFRRVLEIKGRDRNADPGQLAVILTNLGSVLQKRQKCADAEPYLMKALGLLKEPISGVDERMAIAYGNVAEVKNCAGDYPGADEYYQLELSIWKQVLGAANPSYAEKLYNYALKKFRESEYATAEEYFKQALAIWEPNPAKRSDAIWALRMLGRIKLKAKDYVAAEETFSRALNQEGGDACDDGCIPILADLVDVYRAKSDWKGVERCWVRILNIRKAAPPSRTRDQGIARDSVSLAIAVCNQGDDDRGESLLKEAEVLSRRANLGDDALRIIQAGLDQIASRRADRAKP